MIGDIVDIGSAKKTTIDSLLSLLLPLVHVSGTAVAVSIAGESGSGKSVIAGALRRSLEDRGFKTPLLQQDDYFVWPPRTNDRMRRQDIAHVGVSEVRMDLLDLHVGQIIHGASWITKPLVFYQEDRIASEDIDVAGTRFVIVEGTYTSLLTNIHKRVFIDRTYLDTRPDRMRRSRDEKDEFIERVLAVEHDIIAPHGGLADIVVDSFFGVSRRIPAEPRG